MIRAGGLVVWVVLAAMLSGACAADGLPQGIERSVQGIGVTTDDPSSEELAVAAGRRFLDRYVEADGRVVRRDQGGDVVSEGQAYGMLVAVALHDRPTFDRIWSWTQANLQRTDGLLSWQWADGAVTDPMPATDADLDAAHALAVAAERFGDDRYRRDATSIAAAIVELAVIAGEEGPVASAGPWAVEDGWVNPSYGAPAAYAALAELTGAPVWTELDDGARRVVARSSVESDLTPDWAVLASGAVDPRGAPSGGDPRHGYDAARTATRLVLDCDRAGRVLAAAMADEYRLASEGRRGPPAVLDLAGRALVDHGHPVMTVGHAAAVLANGDAEMALDLLHVAERQDREHPTYFGAAWVALGRLWLTTDRLGGCAARAATAVAPAPQPLR